LSGLLTEAGNYGIHVMLIWTPGEHLFSFDTDMNTLFDIKVLSSLTEQDFYNTGLLSLPVDDKDYQSQPNQALVVTKDGNVKIKI